MKVTFEPDEQLVALIGGVSKQVAAILLEVQKMSLEADNLRREVTETKAAVAATQAKVTEVLTLVNALRTALAQAAATGLTPAEVQAMANELDAAQASLTTVDMSIDDAVAQGVPAAPAPAPTPPEAV